MGNTYIITQVIARIVLLKKKKTMPSKFFLMIALCNQSSERFLQGWAAVEILPNVVELWVVIRGVFYAYTQPIIVRAAHQKSNQINNFQWKKI